MSTKTKIALVGILLVSLGAIYKGDDLMTLIEDAQIAAKTRVQDISSRIMDKDKKYIFFGKATDKEGNIVLNESFVDELKTDISSSRGTSIEDKAARYLRRKKTEGYYDLGITPEFQEAIRQLQEQ